MNCIDVVFTKPKTKKGDCPKISVEFYAPPTDKGGCNNISVVFEKIAVDDVCLNTLFWDIVSSSGFDLIINGSGSVVLDGAEEALGVNKPIADGVEIAFCDSANVTSFYARDGGIIGSIPTLPSSIEYFHVFNNGLTGNIPTLPQSIRTFSAYINNLTGSIPTLPSSIEYFHVFNNGLTGSIPTLPQSLETFDVRENNLTGSIPTLPQSIEHFHATNNNLTGNIPTLPQSIKRLVVGENDLDGNIPILPPFLYSIGVGNNNLTGFDGGDAPMVDNLQAYNNSLSVSAVDTLLQSLSENSVIDGNCGLWGVNMGIPTNTTAIDTLRARGWYVSVEGGY